jgi:methylenetetrahydrofolate dehydrogenase (NADP+)/methenyltetrahydrofolate cyclohydrolase
MAAEILDGKRISQEMRDELKTEVEGLAAKGVTPGLGVILVGEDPASRSYVSAKEKACADVGIFSLEASLSADASQQEILDQVQTYNNDERIDGILVQLPLPDASIEEDVLNAVLPEKDVDGFHPVNVGRMMLGLPTFLPCTPHGILHMLKRSGAEVSGAHVVVIGRSNIVGRPIANMLSQKSEFGNATVTLCHTGTRDMDAFTREADILIAAVGRPHTVHAGMVKAGAVVIDVGVNRVEDASRKRGYRLVGDVDYDEVAEKASMITPVPGGVGPMTITMLLYNTVQAARGRLS